MIHFIKNIFIYLYLRYKGVDTKFGYVKLIGRPLISKHSGSKIIIGKHVTLNSKVNGNVVGINHPVMLTTMSKDAVIELKDGCGVSGSAIVAVTKVVIGEYSGLGGNTNIYDTDFHPVNPESRRKQKSVLEAKNAAVVIGKDVLVGMNSVVLKGVTIGDGAFIGAHSVITCNIPARTVWAGNPAKQIKEII